MTDRLTYSELYSDMLKCFSVTKDDTEYKLGDYMRMKAEKKQQSQSRAALSATSDVKTGSSLPVAVSPASKVTAVTAFFSYVNDKMTVKQAPVRDKTIRRFPLRTTITALCSAAIMCCLMLCGGLLGIQSQDSGSNMIIDTYSQTEVTESGFITENSENTENQ